MPKLEVGKKYTDGWGVTQTIGGVVKDHPEWVWSIQGNWYRESDGRKIAYLLIDRKGHLDGARHHVPAERPSNWDLKTEAV